MQPHGQPVMKMADSYAKSSNNQVSLERDTLDKSVNQ